MSRYTVLKKSETHTLVAAPLNYYMYIPNEEFKDDDKYLDQLWSCGVYVIDVANILINVLN